MPMIEGRGITLLGVAFSGLEDDSAIQLALPIDQARPTAPLDLAVDRIRDRFGAAAITRAVLLGRDQGLTVPLLPD
jgi:DNA polymerase-4